MLTAGCGIDQFHEQYTRRTTHVKTSGALEPGCRRSGDHAVTTVAIGCTGGRHRSVCFGRHWRSISSTAQVVAGTAGCRSRRLATSMADTALQHLSISLGTVLFQAGCYR
jgi:hypothetical protein